LNIGTITVAPLLSINRTPLPILSSNRDLDVIIAHDLSPSSTITPREEGRIIKR